MEKIISLLTTNSISNIDGKGYLPDIILPVLKDYEYIFVDSRDKYYKLIEEFHSLNKELVILYVTGDTQMELKMILNLWLYSKPTFINQMENESKLLILGYSNLLVNIPSIFISQPQLEIESSFGWVKSANIDQIQSRIDQLDDDTVVVLPEEYWDRIKTNKKVLNRWQNLENYNKILDCNIDRWGNWLSANDIFSLQFQLGKQATTIYHLIDKDVFDNLPLKNKFTKIDINFMLIKFYSLEQDPKILKFNKQYKLLTKLELWDIDWEKVYTWDPIAVKFLTLCQSDILIFIGCMLSEPSFFVASRTNYTDFMDRNYNLHLVRTAKIILEELDADSTESEIENWARENKISSLPFKRTFLKFKQLYQEKESDNPNLELREIVRDLAKLYAGNIYQYQSKKQIYIVGDEDGEGGRGDMNGGGGGDGGNGDVNSGDGNGEDGNGGRGGEGDKNGDGGGDVNDNESGGDGNGDVDGGVGGDGGEGIGGEDVIVDNGGDEKSWFNTTINLSTSNRPDNIIYLINNHPLVLELTD